MNSKNLLVLLLIIIGITITSCNHSQAITPTNDINSPTTEMETPNPSQDFTQEATIEPTPTLPMAAIINGEGILLSDFNDELKRYNLAVNHLNLPKDEEKAKEVVLNTMEETILLAQGAREKGFVLDDETYKKKYEQLVTDSGGESQMNEWLTNNSYSLDSFERLYRLQIEATWMRDQIISQVATREEQIRARQILVNSKSTAEDIHHQLEVGADFNYYAWGYDQLAGGELGWFPRGYLVLPQIEEAVFNLQPGEYTEVIESTYGYHIVQVMERELDRPLTQDALIQKQKSALQEWLETRKSTSSVILN